MPSRTLAEAVRTGSLADCEQELLTHLQAAVQDVFDTMLSTVCGLVEVAPTEAVPAPRDVVLANVAIEAVVGFSGPASGAVILRCTPGGAVDIARGLLMLGPTDTVPIEEVRDALGECANLVTGALKTRALDQHGDFRLTVPRIDTHIDLALPHRGGQLVYRLAEGSTSIEIWLA